MLVVIGSQCRGKRPAKAAVSAPLGSVVRCGRAAAAAAAQELPPSLTSLSIVRFASGGCTSIATAPPSPGVTVNDSDLKA